jgi:Flp pilus assembly protein TadD
MVLAAATLVALVLGFWLLAQRRPIDAGQQSELAGLQDAIPKAIAARQWSQAGQNIARFEQLAPRDPRAAEWRAQVAEGRKADLPANKDSKREQDRQRALAQAEQLLQQGDYSAAIAWFQRVLASDPESTRARNGLKQATGAKAAEDRVFGGGR